MLDYQSKLKKIAQAAPKLPGIYYWLDKKGVVLYVGRATSLRSRLSQYFQKNLEPRIQEMVNSAVDIKYEETDSILEAIILEAKNIKKHWPKYNVRDRDNRSFIYVVIPKQTYAKPIIIRGHELEKFPAGTAKVFGPYQAYHLLKSALRLIRHIFPYGTCQPNSGRACFDNQIGLCPGACVGKINARDYQKNLDHIALLLGGEKKRLLSRLMKDNPDKIQALKQLQEASLLTKENNLQERRLSRLEGYDISHHAGQEAYGAMVVFENGEANSSQYRLFKIKEAPPGDDERALLEVLLRRFQHEEWALPDLIMIDGGSPQISFLTRALAAKNISLPLVGISKFGGDKLVFPAKTKKEQRLLAENMKSTLLKLREEAHRFANRGRRASSRKKMRS